jgi:hypothetical protein
MIDGENLKSFSRSPPSPKLSRAETNKRVGVTVHRTTHNDHTSHYPTSHPPLPRSGRDLVTSQQSPFVIPHVEQSAGQQLFPGTTAFGRDVKAEHSEQSSVFEELTQCKVSAAIALSPPQFFTPVEAGPDCCTTPSVTPKGPGRESP